MRVALVFNPFSYKLHEENLRIVQRYFGLFPPLSLTWVAAIAERAGHEVIIVDARTLQLTKEDVYDRLREFRPDVLGFMMTTYMFRETLEWVRFLKERLKVPVMVGGYNLRVYPTESVTPEEIDFGCVNSALHTVPALLRELETDRNFGDVPGLVYKDDGKILVTDGVEEDFDDYPFPARHLLPNELYAEFPTERKNFTVMVTSKGCPRSCGFCEAGRTTYNPRKPETVVAEMEECYHKHGVREIDVFDYEFLIHRKRTEEILDLMIAKKLDLTWACRARIDSVDPDLLAKMKASGCSRVYFGIESGDQDTLDRVNKGITIEQIRRTIGWCKDYGIKALGFFLVGVPGETRQSVKRLVKFAKSLDLEYVQFSKLTAKPLTPLWQDMVAEQGYDYWREYILGNVEERPLPRPWTDLSNEEIDELAKWAYVKYHSRLSFLIKSTFRVRSFDEFRRKFYAFMEMVFRQEKVSEAAPDFVAFNENADEVRQRFTSQYQRSPRLPP
ncbi:MAG: B12-binding domain-containing radical SAM protein [Phycisphaerae bacterium]|nr:B12-binding domain-containing radical SAM protein [Phycisphaerae bacterium]